MADPVRLKEGLMTHQQWWIAEYKNFGNRFPSLASYRMLKTKGLTALCFALAINLGFGAAIPTSADDVQPLEVGSAVPAVAVQTTQGETVQLDALTLGQPSVIIFYRGGWCPYCTRHLAALAEIEPELEARGYQILAISADDAEHAATTEADAELSYQLLADPHMDAAKAFGLAYQVDQPTIKKLKKHKIDLETASGETHHLLPVPAVFLSDQEGKIIYRHYSANYRVRLEAEELLKAAK